MIEKDLVSLLWKFNDSNPEPTEKEAEAKGVS